MEVGVARARPAPQVKSFGVLWCLANGLDPESWRGWCDLDYEALPEELELA